MRAVVLDQFGSVDNLYLTSDYPLPEPAAGEVRIRVRAAALNRLDGWVVKGIPGLSLPLPHIPGSDAAGEIDQLGESVIGWQVGDRVVIAPGISCGVCFHCRSGHQNLCHHYELVGMNRSGTYTDYMVVPARNLLKVPDTVPYPTAAAAALVYLTAWHALMTRGNLRAGESVLVIGASGGVSTASIDIARLTGAKVYVVGSGAAKLEAARAMGADEVIDRSVGNWSEAVRERTGGEGVDLVIDSVGRATLPGSVEAARKGGRVVVVGTTTGNRSEADMLSLFEREVSLIGSRMGSHSDFVRVMEQVFAGKLKPMIGATYPLEQSVEALRALESGDCVGKIVLDMV
jgi:NADPH:quinone reductase-like Zn-dependent oxidoreductase